VPEIFYVFYDAPCWYRSVPRFAPYPKGHELAQFFRQLSPVLVPVVGLALLIATSGRIVPIIFALVLLAIAWQFLSSLFKAIR
jgi:hypothetical protein